MAAISVTELISRIRQRSDNEHTGSTFVTDDEILRLINVSYGELYGLLVRYSMNMIEGLTTITADGSESYDLAPDYYSIITVFRKDGDYRHRLERHSARHRPGANPTGNAGTYRVMNNKIELYPRPSNGTYEVVYLPIPATLTSLSNTVDGVLGWEEYLVIDCAIHILDKEESETRHLRSDLDRIKKRIEDEAAAAEMSESWRVETDREVTDDLLMDLGTMKGYRGYRGPIRGRIY